MNKVYNNQKYISSKIIDFLKKIGITRLTQLKIIPFIVIGMILSESTVASDIAKNLKDDFSLVHHDSVIKRIKRFFTNKLFNPYDFYDKVIHYVISTYKKKHNDKRIHIIFDHMFSHDNYTVFMITMRIGKQSIPLWFRCFKDKSNSDAFDTELLKSGITYVSNLFNKDFDLIFLADRWFGSTILLDHISSLGHTYIIRLKSNIKIYFYKDNEYITVSASDLKPYANSAKYFNDIYVTANKFKTNLVLSKSKGVSEHWIIVTNGDSKRAIKDYSYRYGGIETLFKNQKSNGLYMESTVKASIKYFESMYTIACFTSLFLTIIGVDYSKNTRTYKDTPLTTHKNIKGVKKRVLSFFNIGLTLFNLGFNSIRYIRIPFSFTLYDI